MPSRRGEPVGAEDVQGALPRYHRDLQPAVAVDIADRRGEREEPPPVHLGKPATGWPVRPSQAWSAEESVGCL